MSKVRRNDPCPCGSGKKYKHCCFLTEDDGAEEPKAVNGPLLLKVFLLSLAAGIAAGIGLGDWGHGATVFFAAFLLVGGFVVLRKPPPSNPNAGDPSSLNFGR